MVTLKKRSVALFVDRASGQWVVRDPEPWFWIARGVADSWKHRLLFQLAEDAAIEPVLGLYRLLLGLPF